MGDCNGRRRRQQEAGDVPFPAPFHDDMHVLAHEDALRLGVHDARDDEEEKY